MASEEMPANGISDVQFNQDVAEEDDPSKLLADRIPVQYRNSQFDSNRSFLPEGWIDKFITLESVIKELDDKEGRLSPDELVLESGSEKEKLVAFILNQAKRVFAIVILRCLANTTLEAVMTRFMEKGFTDKSLPTTEDKLRDIFRNDDGRLPRYWNATTIHGFVEHQFYFLVPVFSQTSCRFDAEHHYVLPFTKKENFTKEGSFGQVSCVEIHLAHRKNLDLQNATEPVKFAIKEFKIPEDDEKNREERRERLKVWEDEVNNLDETSSLKHLHLIQRIAAIQRREERYLVFLWADGGNLQDFWKANPQPTITVGYVKTIIGQLRGIADAIRLLHDYPHYNEQHNSYHYRHGDIKPENILRFLDGDKLGIGRFVIADMGSAKAHYLATAFRPQSNDKRAATVRYQAPEFLTSKLQSTSRLCDIWALGCVTLELIVWLLYGYGELTRFNETIKDDLGVPCQWFTLKDEQLEDGTQMRVAHRHEAVQTCLDQLAKHPQCIGKTALRDLLHIVRTKLLVVELPVSTPSTTDLGSPEAQGTAFISRTSTQPGPSRYRTNAAGFVDKLNDILEGDNKDKDDYWYSDLKGEVLRSPITVPKITFGNSSSTLAPPRVDQRSGRILEHSKRDDTPFKSGLLAVGQASNHNPQDLSHIWSYPVDNTFAEQLIHENEISLAPHHAGSLPRLCPKCEGMDILGARFRISDSWTELDKNRITCDFCMMRWEVSKHLNRRDHTSVSFERVGSMLRMNDNTSPSLSICRDPALKTTEPIQIGFPQLPASASATYFTILRQWLKKCDQNHKEFKCQASDAPAFVPTRLIDVGLGGSPTVQLYETKTTDRLPYFALSHPWGSKVPFFQTFRRNVEEFKRGIKISDLPATFKDAVQTTRELGQRYLWIDSICIVQKDDTDNGDFDQEAERMENIFSSAYCVLAASSAGSQYDGFWTGCEGVNRDFVKFERKGLAPFYICPFLDDFNNHVLEGPLNKRGWVMQERVLSRRTIYFTDKQTYWQCGEGVRCETLTKMENKLESFFGDPNFPERITSNFTNRGERIKFYEDLYHDYTRLAFTKWEDRPIAIAGLERRLVLDLKTQGGFGVFDDGLSFLPRSLLWQRGKDEVALKKISFPANRHITIPTWSWMAYQGGIDFLELPLGGVIWLPGEIYSPWKPTSSRIYQTTEQTENIELTATARKFDMQGFTPESSRIIYDIPRTDNLALMCVVMGQRQEDASSGDARHYVLYITPKLGVNDVYERVGVGFMPGKFIQLNGSEHIRKVKIR